MKFHKSYSNCRWWYDFCLNQSLFKSTKSMEIHYNDVMISARASQITSLMIVYPTVYSAADQRKLYDFYLNQSLFKSMEIHYNDVIISAMASQITGLMIVTQLFIQPQIKGMIWFLSQSIPIQIDGDSLQWRRQNKRDSVSNHHRWPVNSPHKGPVTRKMFHLMTSSCLMFVSDYILCSSYLLRSGEKFWLSITIARYRIAV